jgi:hypothetical protein
MANQRLGHLLQERVGPVRERHCECRESHCGKQTDVAQILVSHKRKKFGAEEMGHHRSTLDQKQNTDNVSQVGFAKHPMQ